MASPGASEADWLAFSRQTALAAVSPALVFFVWTSTLGTDDAQLLLTVAFCVTTGAFVLAQNVALLDQRRSWLVSQRGATVGLTRALRRGSGNGPSCLLRRGDRGFHAPRRSAAPDR